jgi:hypothetical protein
LISIKDRGPAIRHISLHRQQELAMPIDSILVSAAVVAVFALFSVVMIWANFQTGSAGQQQQQQPANVGRRRRSF